MPEACAAGQAFPASASDVVFSKIRMSGRSSGKGHQEGTSEAAVVAPTAGHAADTGHIQLRGRGSERDGQEAGVMSTGAAQPQPVGGDDLVPLEELIRRSPGAHPISSMDELRSDAFETDQELYEFLAFVTQSRHADLA
jgi:hypothetical protein